MDTEKVEWSVKQLDAREFRTIERLLNDLSAGGFQIVSIFELPEGKVTIIAKRTVTV